jgi:PAS domain S-box-containing protein
MTLRVKMILGGSIAVLIPLIIISVIIFINLSDSLLKIYEQKTIQAVKDISSIFSTLFFEELKIAEIIAVDSDMVNAVYNENYKDAERELKAIHSRIGRESNNFSITDRYGIVRADALFDDQIGVDLSDREYFLKAKDGYANIGNPIIARSQGSAGRPGIDIVIIACAPIFTENGFSGTINNIMRIDYFDDLIVSSRVGKSGYPFVIDSDGTIIIHPQNEKILKTNIYDEPGMKELAEQISQKDTGTGYYTIDGIKKHVAFTLIESIGWTLLFTQNSEEIFAPANSVFFILVISAVIFIVIVNLIMILLSKKISSPVQKMLELLKNITKYSDDIIINIGLDRKINFANSSVEKITGKSINEIIGTEPILTNTQNISKEEIWKELEECKSWSGRIIINDHEGNDITIAALIFPVFDNSGTLQGYIQIGKDITNELLLRTRLEQTQKMEELGSITGGIAHDFNNILTGILGYAELVLSVKKVPEEVKEYNQGIIKAAKRARDLVRQILLFSRQDNSELQPVIPKYIIEDAVQLINVSKPPYIELEIILQSDSLIMAEPTQLHQIIMNLYTNSIHAMEEKKGKIEIIMKDMFFNKDNVNKFPDIKPGKYLFIKISDTGKGIDNKILSKIFDPFFTTKPREKGTGLGLSVVHGIIKKLGGYIYVFSEIGKGTEFNIYLPVVDREKLVTDSPFSETRKGNERLMIIDDEEIVVDVFKKNLSNLGYKINGFTSSTEALNEFRSNPYDYDIIFTDYMMPELTGLEISEEYLRIRREIPIILMSGFITEELVEKSRIIGIARIINKPLSTFQLGETIREILA